MLGPLFEMNNAPFGGYEGLYHFYNDIEIGRLLEERDETGAFEGINRVADRFLKGIRMICDSDEGNVLISCLDNCNNLRWRIKTVRLQ